MRSNEDLPHNHCLRHGSFRLFHLYHKLLNVPVPRDMLRGDGTSCSSQGFDRYELTKILVRRTSDEFLWLVKRDSGGAAHPRIAPLPTIPGTPSAFLKLSIHKTSCCKAGVSEHAVKRLCTLLSLESVSRPFNPGPANKQSALVNTSHFLDICAEALRRNRARQGPFRLRAKIPWPLSPVWIKTCAICGCPGIRRRPQMRSDHGLRPPWGRSYLVEIS